MKQKTNCDTEKEVPWTDDDRNQFNSLLESLMGKTFFIYEGNEIPFNFNEIISFYYSLDIIDKKVNFLEYVINYVNNIVITKDNAVNSMKDDFFKLTERFTIAGSEKEVFNTVKEHLISEFKEELLRLQNDSKGQLSEKEPAKIIHTCKSENDLLYILLRLKEKGFISQNQTIEEIAKHFVNQDGESIKDVKQRVYNMIGKDGNHHSKSSKKINEIIIQNPIDK